MPALQSQAIIGRTVSTMGLRPVKCVCRRLLLYASPGSNIHVACYKCGNLVAGTVPPGPDNADVFTSPLPMIQVDPQ